MKKEKKRKALGKHNNLYSMGISQMVKIRDVYKLRQDIENDLIIRDQMADLGCLLVYTFSSLFAPVLVLAHTINNLDLCDEPENEGYEILPSPSPRGINKHDQLDNSIL